MKKLFSQIDHDNFLIEIKSKMLNKKTLIDSAIFDINNLFFDLAFCDGGDDSIVQYDSNKFVFQMTIRLNPEDVEFWDANIDDKSELDLELYCKKRDEILNLIKENKLTI